MKKKTIKYQISRKIRPVAAEMFHADGKTDITKLTVAFLPSLKIITYIRMLCLFALGATAPQWAKVSSFTRFSRSHTTTHHIGIGLLCMSDYLVADLYLTTHNIHNRQTSILPGGIRTHNHICECTDQISYAQEQVQTSARSLP